SRRAQGQLRSPGSPRPVLQPPSPPEKPPPWDEIESLEGALVLGIQTAGLKPGREKQLVEEAKKLHKKRKAWVEASGKLFRQWAEHAHLLWELHKKELTRLGQARQLWERDNTRRISQLMKHMDDERQRGVMALAEERRAAEAQIRAMKEAQQIWKNNHREETTAAMERELAR
ncbi:unnamed protein product, partial [Discosporangium mesarthrocarpum]